MTAAGPVARFRAAVERHFGLHFDDSKLDWLAEVQRRSADASGGADMADALAAGGLSPGALRHLAQELTVGETYFFRNSDQFHALAEVVIPQRLRARAAVRRLSILSAGCASGEEAYTLAIVAGERLPAGGWSMSITGVDVNATALEKARSGRYSEWSLRETTPELRRRWFAPEGRDHLVAPTIRAAVRFEERNLVAADAELWRGGAYDVVFCRNVLMYFEPEAARRVVERITYSLAPGGYLFLGHAETLRGLSNDYHLRHSHGTFYYQKRDGAPAASSMETSPRVPTPRPIRPPDDTLGDTWVETIQRASARIKTLSEGGAAKPAATARRAWPAPELGRAIELLRSEQFGQALELVADLEPDPEVLLLRAVLHTHGGQLDAAERVCGELLALDELNAGAHYLMALCREGAGDRKRAIEHDRVSVYLDPAFAMPHLHLGIMARRAGEAPAARRELATALELLAREDGSRLLLFGGGFTREALAKICRGELASAGGER